MLQLNAKSNIASAGAMCQVAVGGFDKLHKRLLACYLTLIDL